MKQLKEIFKTCNIPEEKKVVYFRVCVAQKIWVQIKSTDLELEAMGDAILRLINNKTKFAALIKNLKNILLKNYLTIQKYCVYIQH